MGQEQGKACCPEAGTQLCLAAVEEFLLLPAAQPRRHRPETKQHLLLACVQCACSFTCLRKCCSDQRWSFNITWVCCSLNSAGLLAQLTGAPCCAAVEHVCGIAQGHHMSVTLHPVWVSSPLTLMWQSIGFTAVAMLPGAEARHPPPTELAGASEPAHKHIGGPSKRRAAVEGGSVSAPNFRATSLFPQGKPLGDLEILIMSWIFALPSDKTAHAHNNDFHQLKTDSKQIRERSRAGTRPSPTPTHLSGKHRHQIKKTLNTS